MIHSASIEQLFCILLELHPRAKVEIEVRGSTWILVATKGDPSDENFSTLLGIGEGKSFTEAAQDLFQSLRERAN
jgi:hypothetical protein